MNNVKQKLERTVAFVKGIHDHGLFPEQRKLAMAGLASSRSILIRSLASTTLETINAVVESIMAGYEL
jgi:hypothetical protein